MERKFERTHPWLTFNLPDVMTRTPVLWALLGECQSKCEHLAGVLIDPEQARRLHQIYLVRGAVATTQIEGNPLAEEQLQAALDNRAEIAPAQEYHQREQLNIIDACNGFIAELEGGFRAPVTWQRIQALNTLVLEGTDLREGVVPGQVSEHAVVVGNVYLGAPRRDCEFLMRKLCEFLASSDFNMPDHMFIGQAILRALVAHLYLAWIHPFGDGNGRTARLLEVQILLTAGVSALAAHLLSNHYCATREAYYRELKMASETRQIVPFLVYALRGFVVALAEQITHVRNFQRQLIWDDYLVRQFDLTREPEKRRFRLMKILPRVRSPFAVSRLRALDPEIELLYAKLDQKTVSRDINALRRMDLVQVDDVGLLSVNQDVLKAFAVRQYPVRPHVAGIA